MKAAILTGLRTIEVGDAPEPELTGPGDVKLQVDVVGLCGSDMHYYRRGRIGEQVVQFPWIIGHECAGTVLDIGSEVTALKPGDRVAVDPCQTCGRCDQCLAGRAHTCRNQTFLGNPGQTRGALAERVVIRGECCYRLPEGVTAVRGALVEPFSIGVYAERMAGGTAHKAVGILGAGPIGLSVLKAIRAAGEARVYMTEIRPPRVELARQCGADRVGNPRQEDVVAEILRREPLGLDLVYECAGEQEALDAGVRLLKPGGTLLGIGIPEFGRWSFCADLFRRNEISLQSVRRQNECVGAAIELLAGGRVSLDELVTHEFPLSRTPEAFEIVADYRDGVVKAMIHVAGSV